MNGMAYTISTRWVVDIGFRRKRDAEQGRGPGLLDHIYIYTYICTYIMRRRITSTQPPKSLPGRIKYAKDERKQLNVPDDI